jgi:hypothetical protein
MFFEFFCTGQTENNDNNTHNGHPYILRRSCSCWTMDDDARRDRPPASFDYQIYIQHINKPRLVSELNFFQTFFDCLFTEFPNEGGRKPRQPPPRQRRTGLILIYWILGDEGNWVKWWGCIKSCSVSCSSRAYFWCGLADVKVQYFCEC